LLLQNLTALGVLTRTDLGNSTGWSFKEDKYDNLVRRIENIGVTEDIDIEQEDALDDS